jgi:aminobenzoyl-glutamate utilization protein A
LPSGRLGPGAISREAIIGAPPASAIEAAKAQALASGALVEDVERMPDGTTALIAELRRSEGPIVAMRFDVDALALNEDSSDMHRPRRLGFASAAPGLMHACGHDGHATIGLAIAEFAAQNDTSWSGTLRLIFQPAEEGGRGARAMVEAGAVDGVDLFVALHLGCDLPSCEIACAAKSMMFSAKWDVVFRGTAAHAAGNPENGRNALLAGAQAVTALYALPRHGCLATHVNVGRFQGGTARNVIADRAELEIELRGEAAAALDHMERRARWTLDGIAAAHGCELVVTEMGRTIGAETSPPAASLIRAVAEALPDIERVHDDWPLGGGDDAAFFMRRVQDQGGLAAYLILGSDLAAGHHAINFDFEEADIGIGVRLMAGVLAAATNGGFSFSDERRRTA